MPANRRMLIVALIFGLIVAGVVFAYFRQLQQKAKAPPVEMVMVMTADKAIPARTIVTQEMIAPKQLPKTAVTDDMVKEGKEALGKVTVSAIIPGEVLLKPKFAEKGARMGLSFIVPRGMRAVTIQVSESTGIAGLLKPGDFVDVIGTFQFPQEEEKTTLDMSITVLQNVQVLALDTGMEAKKEEGGKITLPVYTYVTLAVTPKDAERVTLLLEKSPARLVLRPIKEKVKVISQGTTIYSLIGKKPPLMKKAKVKKVAPEEIKWLEPGVPGLPPISPTQAVKPKPTIGKGERLVEIIRGTEVEKVGVKK